MTSQLDRLEQDFQKYFGSGRLPKIPAPDALPELTEEQLAEGDMTAERL